MASTLDSAEQALRRRRRKSAFGPALVASAPGVVLLVVLMGVYLAMDEAVLEAWLARLRGYGPLPFFLALGCLTAIGFPTTPFFLLAGSTFGAVTGVIGSGLATGLNLVLAYGIARYGLRQWLERGLDRAGYRVPRLPARHQFRTCLLVRLTPGPPSFLKSYLLALASVRFGLFLSVSWPTGAAYAVGVILLGDSMVDRDPVQAVAALGLIGLVGGGFYLLRRRLAAARGEGQVGAGRVRENEACRWN